MPSITATNESFAGALAINKHILIKLCRAVEKVCILCIKCSTLVCAYHSEIPVTLEMVGTTWHRVYVYMKISG